MCCHAVRAAGAGAGSTCVEVSLYSSVLLGLAPPGAGPRQARTKPVLSPSAVARAGTPTATAFDQFDRMCTCARRGAVPNQLPAAGFLWIYLQTQDAGRASR
jgi:hypothetical protein